MASCILGSKGMLFSLMRSTPSAFNDGLQFTGNEGDSFSPGCAFAIFGFVFYRQVKVIQDDQVFLDHLASKVLALLRLFAFDAAF